MKTEVKSIGNIDVSYENPYYGFFLILTMCRICKPQSYMLTSLIEILNAVEISLNH